MVQGKALAMEYSAGKDARSDLDKCLGVALRSSTVYHRFTNQHFL